MIKVSLLVLAGLTVVKLLRSQSAALRHWVLWAAIACAGVVPAVEPIVPGWNVRPLGASTARQVPGPVAVVPAPQTVLEPSAPQEARPVTAHRSHHPV